MGTSSRGLGRAVLILGAAGLLFGLLYLAVAAPYLSSHDEDLVLDGFRVSMSYSDSASATDLMLPFYPGSEVEDSCAYSVTTKEGKAVVQYAWASLTTGAPWEKVAEYYSAELPGHPTAEAMEDQSGKRYVFAVAGEDEVRTVTVRPAEEGSHIELVRATHPKSPTRPIKPRPAESVI